MKTVGGFPELAREIEKTSRLSAFEKRLFQNICMCRGNDTCRRNLVIQNLDYDTRNRFIELLGELGEAAPDESMAVLDILYIDDFLTKKIMCASISRFGEKAIDAGMQLLEKLGKDQYPEIRRTVAETVAGLGRKKGPQVVEILMTWSFDEDRRLREICARALAEHRITDNGISVAILDRLSVDVYSSIRFSSAQALNLYMPYCSESALAVLRRMMNDSRWSIRQSIAFSLRNVQPQCILTALEMLGRLAMDLVPAVSQTAAESFKHLADLFPERCLALFDQLAGDTDILDVGVIKTIIAISRDWAEKRPQLSERLLTALLSDLDEEIRDEASRALKSIRSKKS